MISEKELFEKVEEAVRTVLNTDEGEIKKDSMFKADLDAESIDYLDISYEIEQRTGMELDFTEALQYITDRKGADITDVSVQDVLDYMMHAIKEKEKEQ
ncbi:MULTISPECIES: acyl carrier protein [unclassified Prosthecochloris]|uniref:acyl carrier protein n=1 Tax=unclassified Prosthecochloris TaxID=2632826 RepID=UPI00223E04B1|nr:MULTISPECIES: phosphopantetheine-binding protein [unclassified Prosthecochloris]UZJ37478.1 phosphopantetheine-binding protein [Prosthecochloris sp. SCSIO W1103]UZJ39301.1 phosphopantetheine-binding protein [Prosthecochloris sp. SCSIO W1102]